MQNCRTQSRCNKKHTSDLHFWRNQWDLNPYSAPSIKRPPSKSPVFLREYSTRRLISALLDLGRVWGFCGA